MAYRVYKHRGYSIQFAAGRGYFEISQHGEVIDTAETLRGAKALIDSWMDAR